MAFIRRSCIIYWPCASFNFATNTTANDANAVEEGGGNAFGRPPASQQASQADGWTDGEYTFLQLTYLLGHSSGSDLCAYSTTTRIPPRNKMTIRKCFNRSERFSARSRVHGTAAIADHRRNDSAEEFVRMYICTHVHTPMMATLQPGNSTTKESIETFNQMAIDEIRCSLNF